MKIGSWETGIVCHWAKEINGIIIHFAVKVAQADLKVADEVWFSRKILFLVYHPLRCAGSTY